MGNNAKGFEYHAKALDEIAVRHNLPFILAMKTTEDGKSLRAAFGSIDDTVTLLAIMLVQLHRQTVWEKTTVNRSPSYVRHEERKLYWEQTNAQETDRTPKKSALIIIPTDSVTYVPKPDDRILPGIHEEEQPPKTALTVMSVRDFRYASIRAAHVEVKAE